MILSLLIHVTNGKKKKSKNQDAVRMLRIFTVWLHTFQYFFDEIQQGKNANSEILM